MYCTNASKYQLSHLRSVQNSNSNLSGGGKCVSPFWPEEGLTLATKKNSIHTIGYNRVVFYGFRQLNFFLMRTHLCIEKPSLVKFSITMPKGVLVY